MSFLLPGFAGKTSYINKEGTIRETLKWQQRTLQSGYLLSPFFVLMPANPLEELRLLAARIQNLPTTTEGARQLSDFVTEGVALLTTLEGQTSGRVALRCHVSRSGLQTEVLQYLSAYEQATDKREKITRMTQARSQAHYLIWQVLAASRR